MGVTIGLEECARRYAGGVIILDVIGDSAPVTRQLQGRATVRTTKFQAPFERSLQALTTIDKYEFYHTRRAGNKMADRIANHAMDQQTTITWFEGANEHEDVTNILEGFLLGDCATPMSLLRPSPTMCTQLRQKYELPAPPQTPGYQIETLRNANE